ncbi:MAG: efflux RND transporter periplasmic adaptor subunit [Bdellovibrionales bacterium]|nr:efflux RND transporter periplasmic adaptor subunit [Bdellovibrionales bacterium]
MKKIHLGLVTLLLALGACTKHTTLKAVQAKKTEVEATVSTITSGTVDAEQQAVLGFSTSGRVRSINVKLGDKVEKGQVLAETENADLQTTSQDADSEWKRSQTLFKEGLISKAGLDDARRAFEVARSNYDKSVIRAPFAGMVTELNLEVGELAQTTTNTKAPLRLVDLKPRIVKGDIDEVELSKVKVGAAARLKILAVRSQPFAGTVTKVVPFVESVKEQDRSAHIELMFTESSENIPVGASTDIEIVVAAKSGALAIPSRAVLGSGTNRHVFKVQNGSLKEVAVKLGVGNYDRTEVIEGVNEGDVIALPTPDLELKDGQKTKVDIQPWP